METSLRDFTPRPARRFAQCAACYSSFRHDGSKCVRRATIPACREAAKRRENRIGIPFPSRMFQEKFLQLRVHRNEQFFAGASRFAGELEREHGQEGQRSPK